MEFRRMLRLLTHLLLLPILCLLFMGTGSMVNAASLSWTSKAPMPIPMSRGNANVVNGILYVLGGTGAAASAVQAYNPATDSWALQPPLPQPMFTAASAVLNEKIYLAGGYDPSGQCLPGVFSYDTITGTSQQVGNLVVPRSRFSGAIVNNRMYVVGGSSANGPLGSIEEIDLASGDSTIKQNLPVPTSLAGVTAVDGKVYIFGGNASGVGPVAASWEYDPQTNELTPLPPMPVASEFETALPHNGKIYLVSSMPWSMPDQNNLIQAYDIQNRSWEIVSSVPTTRDVPMAGIINGTLYVAGGFSDGSASGTVNEALFLGTVEPGLSWTTKASLPVPMHAGNANVVNGVLYILGGTSPTGTGEMLDTVQAYDPRTDSWRLLPPLPGQMFTAGSAVLNEKIYVAGGYSSFWQLLPGVFSYDTITGASQQIGTLVEPRSRFSGAIVDNKFYAVGGTGYSGPLSSIEEMDLDSGYSAIRQYLPRPVSLAGVAAAGGKVFIFGGYVGDEGVVGESWQYDPQSTELVSLPPMAVPCEMETALPHGGKIYVVCSMPSDTQNQNLVQAYDIQNRSWEIVSSVPTTRSVPMAGIINGTLHVAGGYVAGSSENGTLHEALPLGGGAGPTLTLHSVNFNGTFSYIDWPTSQHGPLNSGSYLQINGVYYIVIMSSPGSWNGPDYSSAWLAHCDQVSGTTFYPYYPNYYPSPDLSGMVGMPMTLFASWPLPVPPDFEAPTISVSFSGAPGANGWFTSDVTLYLFSMDNPGGSGTRVIEYSYDGVNWQMFYISLAISQPGNNQIYYRASDYAGNVSDVALLTFNIDKTAPTTTATIAGTAGSNGWLISPATLTLSASDPATTRIVTAYSLDGSSWTNYTAPVNFANEGDYTILYRSTDEAGLGEAIKTVQFKIDLTPPVVAHTLTGTMGENGRYTSDVSVALTATETLSGPVRIEYSTDGAAWIVYSGTPVTISAAGVTDFRYRAVNAAGLTAGPANSLTFTIDKIAPAVESTVPALAATNVPLNQVISITFSEDVVAGSSFSGITMKKGKTVVPISVDAIGTTLQITPAAALAKNTAYTVSIPAGAVKDLAGKPLAEPVIFSFTTARR